MIINNDLKRYFANAQYAKYSHFEAIAEKSVVFKGMFTNVQYDVFYIKLG